MSPGANHSGKSDDKDDDYAFPVDAVNEDTELNIYENPIHPIEQSDDNNSAPGPVIRIRSHGLSNSNVINVVTKRKACMSLMLTLGRFMMTLLNATFVKTPLKTKEI